jgi:hypothetical protein
MAKPNGTSKYLNYEPWSSLYDIPVRETGTAARTDNARTKKTPDAANGDLSGAMQLSVSASVLASGIVTDISANFRTRVASSHLSARQAEEAKKELVEKELAKEVWLGRSLFLAPTRKLFMHLQVACPYPHEEWQVHDFLCLFTKAIVEKHPLVQYVRIEQPIDDHGSAPDLTVQYKDGLRTAIEVIHRTTGNIVTHAAALRNKGFARVMFLCPTLDISNAVRRMLMQAGLDREYLDHIHCTFFAALLKKQAATERR